MEHKDNRAAMEIYEEREKHYSSLAQKYKHKANKISNLRLLIVLLGIIAVVLLYRAFGVFPAFVVSVVLLAVFVLLVIKHRSYTKKKNYFSILTEINREGKDRAEGKWNAFSDTGDEFLDKDHPYALDLDIFGQGSLFQWINTTTTSCGRKKLKEYLTCPPHKIETIKKRQQAILELSNKLDWRQNLMTKGRMSSNPRSSNPEDLFSWAKEKNNLYLNPWLIQAVRILPVITVLFIFLAIFTGISYTIPLLMAASHILILLPGYASRVQEFNLTTSKHEELTAYKNMLVLLESESFDSPLLTRLKQSVNNPKSTGATASAQLKQLEKIVDAISQRHSQLYIVFNTLFLLDFHWKISLEKWKKQSGNKIEEWFHVLGKVEALSSLSVIPFDNPEWVMPEITEEPGKFKAENLGHPLITTGHRVCNDVKISPPVNTLLITGSNMSGKSTLLRTAGINLVMAYIGAPACANSFDASLMNIYTCMQVSDNLEKNISSFYGELLRIKHIVKTAENEPVFFLLDEIFKGTNSKDRHIGARAVIKKLHQEKAVGLVSTHDLELGVLEKERAGIKNYHFREYYQNNKIYFDYILRPGLSPTTNAIYLMKLAGIEPEK